MGGKFRIWRSRAAEILGYFYSDIPPSAESLDPSTIDVCVIADIPPSAMLRADVPNL